MSSTVAFAERSERRVHVRPCARPDHPISGKAIAALVLGIIGLASPSFVSLVRLEVSERDPQSGERSRVAYTIDPRTGRIAALIVDGLVANVRTLPSLPRIPKPMPLCVSPAGR